MSDNHLPFTVPRRRHRDLNQSPYDVVDFADQLDGNGKEKDKKGLVSTSSLSNTFTSLISAPAASLWNTAQATLTPSQSSNSLKESPSSSSLGQDFARSSTPVFIVEEMPCRDRTAEFRTTAKSYQMKWQATANGHSSAKPKQKLVQDSVQFNQLAKRIGRDLSQTCAKMEKLAELAKRRSLFDDRMSEVEELTHIIKQDITGLNKQIATLQEFARNRSQNGVSLRPQGQNHSRSVVVGLQSKLASVSSEFKNVLEIRTENMKQQKTRREKFSQSQPIPSSLPPSASSGNMGSILLQDEAAASAGSSSIALDMSGMERERMQQQLTLIDEQDSYLQARSSTMETIESSIAELGSIFRQLANLVSEQGETITRIDSNVEETSLNVEAAHMELLKYFRNISRNRWLMIKVFGVLIVFFIIFIVFLT
uniref:t-SNARE coiled-coil homology domain-containing protein n=1 Tax=Plectus sambesii TaxID=2011161 RepID=A0A914X1M0_9BILA